MSDHWALAELNLFADGMVRVRYGDLSVDLDRGALRLNGVSHGVVRDGLFTIAPGDALFTVSGAVSGQAPDVRGAWNGTPITAHRSAEGWTIDSFTVTHIDPEGQVWEVTVPPTTWD